MVAYEAEVLAHCDVSGEAWIAVGFHPMEGVVVGMIVVDGVVGTVV